jgi:hypothetical protein
MGNISDLWGKRLFGLAKVLGERLPRTFVYICKKSLNSI